jgi:DNA-binding Xre family transcriptional regulator
MIQVNLDVMMASQVQPQTRWHSAWTSRWQTVRSSKTQVQGDRFSTLCSLCEMLDCEAGDILVYVKGANQLEQYPMQNNAPESAARHPRRLGRAWLLGGASSSRACESGWSWIISIGIPSVDGDVRRFAAFNWKRMLANMTCRADSADARAHRHTDVRLYER